MEERILVWAPLRDGQLTCSFLTEEGFACVACPSWEALQAELRGGVGVVVIAGEFLSPNVLANLRELIGSQPPWSDLPVTIVTGTEAVDHNRFSLLGNVSLLQRPVALDTLQSTIRAALRARRRQYQIRDLLRQRDEADRRKDEFLAMLGHELRNPLAPLRTGMELLKLQPSAAVVDRAKATMERQIGNLTRLVDDLLDVSRITRRQIALKKVHLDARDVIRDAIASCQPLARQQGVDLVEHVPSASVGVHADPVRLEQMIGSLIGNAIKFTPSGGSIHLTLEKADPWAVIRVRDTGIGIAADQVARVFELFEQAAPSIDRSKGGLGIGLTVVRLIAELHGGQAEIFSGGEGAGTEAVIRLPLHQEPAMPSAWVPPVAGLHNAKRVLLIEDNLDVADMLAEYLRQRGHAVICAGDGRAGLNAAVEHLPQVIVCDIGLPGLDGYEVARRLRDQPAFQSCCLIAVSGYGDAGDREKARAAGFAHHVTKPADPVALAELIAREP
jgi:signal transduction histidine kinase/CheY-like chemotaxis protein